VHFSRDVPSYTFRETNYIFTLLIISFHPLTSSCCLGISLFLFSHTGFSPDHTWFAWSFLCAAALTLLNSVLTLVGGRLKKRRLLQACLVSNAVVVLLLTGLCATGYIIAGELSDQVG